MFYQNSDRVWLLNYAEKMKAENFENKHDVYIVDKDFE
jgi:hypothetical protein